MALIVLMVGLTMAASTNDAVSVYVIPFVLVPIFLKTFFDIRYALFVHMITLLLAGFWVPNSLPVCTDEFPGRTGGCVQLALLL